MSTLFEAHELTKCYGSITALHIPFFTMEKGETVALTGRNGSGKSTLLRLLAFLETPTSGTLRYFGRQDDPRREITLLLQEPYLMKASVFWNVTLGLRLRGFDAKAQKKGYEESMLLRSGQHGLARARRTFRRRETAHRPRLPAHPLPFRTFTR